MVAFFCLETTMSTIDENIKTVYDYFPSVGRRILLYWGTPSFYPYLNGLMIDSHQNVLPNVAFDALVELQNIHDRDFPHLLKICTNAAGNLYL